VKDREGKISTVRTEPQGVHNVLRLKQEFADNSWIGAICTGVVKENTTPALTGGGSTGTFVLAMERTRSRDISAVLGHRVLLRNALELQAGCFFHAFPVSTGSTLRRMIFYTRFFDINDVGFFAQPHDYGGYVQFLYSENFARGMFRRYSIALNPEYCWNWDAIRTHAVVNSSFTGELTPILPYRPTSR
jgi:hypothetical protein